MIVIETGDFAKSNSRNVPVCSLMLSRSDKERSAEPTFANAPWSTDIGGVWSAKTKPLAQTRTNAILSILVECVRSMLIGVLRGKSLQCPQRKDPAFADGLGDQ